MEDAKKTALIDEVKGIIAQHYHKHISETNTTKRTRISAANVASTKGEEEESSTERCATALMEKFLSMGSKAGKSG